MIKSFLFVLLLSLVWGGSFAQTKFKRYDSEFDQRVKQRNWATFAEVLNIKFNGNVKLFKREVECYFTPYNDEDITFPLECKWIFLQQYDREGYLIANTIIRPERKDTFTDKPNEVVMGKDDFLIKTVFEFHHEVDKEKINRWNDPLVYDKSVWTDTYNDKHQLSKHAIVLYFTGEYVADYECTYTYNDDGNLLEEDARENFNKKHMRYNKTLFTYNSIGKKIKVVTIDSTTSGIDSYFEYYLYDNKGNFIGASGENQDGMNIENSKENYQYDSLNRLVYCAEGQNIKCIYYPVEGGEIDTFYDIKQDDKGIHKKEEYCYICCKNKHGDLVKKLIKNKGKEAILCEYNEYQYDEVGNIVVQKVFSIKDNKPLDCIKEIHQQYEYYK